jgi:hypothetical protein
LAIIDSALVIFCNIFCTLVMSANASARSFVEFASCVSFALICNAMSARLAVDKLRIALPSCSKVFPAATRSSGVTLSKDACHAGDNIFDRVAVRVYSVLA